jgi:hypothetical protein
MVQHKLSVDDVTNLVCFYMQYMIEHMLIPGKVENWIILTDLCHQSPSALPIAKMKAAMNVMQQAFRCRLVKNYIINGPKQSSLAWLMIQGLLKT